MTENKKFQSRNRSKMRSIKGLKEFGHKFKDKLESEAIDFIVKTAKDFGPKLTIPILIDLMKNP